MLSSISKPAVRFLRKKPVFIGTLITGAFFFEMGYTKFTDSLWDYINRGRQWKDIEHKYQQ
ncbi:hypothetical protein MIR68_002876 [Amoeboaphelidium protococcarum]|nr:hypothetical protein MIR68_002876 [Amoeboaphelidium protococcarum]KAI3647878.1 hypothetical protein MP228_008099 [Amoeboaphelidium protococcarum]KAI3653580.1 hypothetical protein MP228_001527 [Amoeboaphelidium protococcarum]